MQNNLYDGHAYWCKECFKKYHNPNNNPRGAPKKYKTKTRVRMEKESEMVQSHRKGSWDDTESFLI